MVPPQPTFVITMVVVFWVGLVVATNIWSNIEKNCRGAEQIFLSKLLIIVIIINRNEKTLKNHINQQSGGNATVPLQYASQC